jgi:hypothetical protein
VKRAVAAVLVLLIASLASAKDEEMPATIQDVKARHSRQLLDAPGVVSVGIGLDPQGRETIVVGLDRPRPETQAALPTQLEGYPVRVEIIGAVKAQ